MAMNIAVIGGGASGLMAAISAANHVLSKAPDKDIKVCLIEKSDRVGRKILATGNGRCNITNTSSTIERYHGGRKSFIETVLSEFTVKQTMNYFDSIGLLLKTEDTGKVYPYSDQASGVLDVLRSKAADLGVDEICNFGVSDIRHGDKGFEILGSNKKINADRVIVCCGGAAAASLGTDGSSYRLLTQYGHKKTDIFPSLVQIKTNTDLIKALKGIKFTGSVSIKNNTGLIKTDYGEVLFTEYGISGPPVFQLSRIISEHFNKKSSRSVQLYAVLDTMYDWPVEEIEKYLIRRKHEMKNMNLEIFLTGVMNKRIGQTIIKYCGFPLSMEAGALTDQQIKKLAFSIKNFTLACTGTLPFQSAQVTAGGIDTGDFSPVTLESRLRPGLFAAGEILDADGDCGGFNLQWAWSSGFIAGKAAAESCM